jgi:hypothetical protein
MPRFLGFIISSGIYQLPYVRRVDIGIRIVGSLPVK